MLLKFITLWVLGVLVVSANTPYPGDIDQDGNVDMADFSSLVSRLGQGVNSIFDFNRLVVDFGKSTLATNNTGVLSISVQSVPTFESVGLGVTFTGDINNNSKALVEYKTPGSSQWKSGSDLFTDRTPPNENQYRGSLVHLTPNTTYDIRLNVIDPDGAPPTSAASSSDLA